MQIVVILARNVVKVGLMQNQTNTTKVRHT